MPCPRRPGEQPLLTPWVRFFSSKMDVFITYYPTCESGAFPFGSDPWTTPLPWPILQLYPPAIREEKMGAAGEEQLQEEEAPPPLDTRYGCPLCHVQAPGHLPWGSPGKDEGQGGGQGVTEDHSRAPPPCGQERWGHEERQAAPLHQVLAQATEANSRAEAKWPEPGQPSLCGSRTGGPVHAFWRGGQTN